MSDAKSAVEAVFYTVLAGGITGARVFQDVPEDAMPVSGDGLVVIGDLKSEPFGGKADPDRRIGIIVVAQVTAEERAPLLALQSQIEQLLDGKTFDSGGWTLALTLDDDDAQLAEDGVSYVGTSAFTVFALKD